MLQHRIHRGVSVRRVEAFRTNYPHRTVLVVSESLVTLAGLGGAIGLVTGASTPPMSAIAPLGLTSWVLPGVWLAATVVLPSATAGVLAWRGSPRAPQAVVAAAVAMAVEVLVQVPFVGPNPLQGVFGSAAVALAAAGLHARRSGWPARSAVR